MKNKKLLAITIVLTLALSLVGVVYAQDIIAMDVESDEMEAYGAIEELALDYLIVDGVRYELTMDTEIEEDIEVGDWVKVKYYVEDELNIAIEVELEDPEYDEMEVYGTVEELAPDYLIVDGVRYELTMDTEIEEDIAVGDWVKVKYYVEDELNIAIEVELEDADEEEDDDMDDDNMEDSAVCSGALIHPALEGLAMEYVVEYETLLPYFCEQHFGIGEIEHALKTAEMEDVEMTWVELLEMRSSDDDENGWGEIWQELGLIGKDADKEEGDEPEGFVNQNKEKNAEKGKTNKDNKGKSNRP